jgi:hypothetical protein
MKEKEVKCTGGTGWYWNGGGVGEWGRGGGWGFALDLIGAKCQKRCKNLAVHIFSFPVLSLPLSLPHNPSASVVSPYAPSFGARLVSPYAVFA